MSTRWRFIDAAAMDAPVAFGRMPIIAASVANGGPQVLMTGMFGRGHFQIGWFEDVDAVMDLGAARARGVQVFRRPVWGGGTAFYDTHASALLSFFIHDTAFATLDDALEHFRPVMRQALDSLGLQEAQFEGSSDIRWQGRKLGTLIAQSVLGTKVVGGFFNLRSPDLETYAAIARVPEEKFKDKIIKDQVAYICTPRDVRGRDLPYEEFRDAMVKASRSHGGLMLDPTGFTADEDLGTKGFADTVSADDYVRRVSTERFRAGAPGGARVGFANLKARKLIRAGVALDGDGVILAAMVAGDMHVSPPDAMDRLASSLTGARAEDRADLVARAEKVFAEPDVDQPDQAAGITAEDCAEAVQLAARNATTR
jgi:lipoate-protein ligase A